MDDQLWRWIGGFIVHSSNFQISPVAEGVHDLPIPFPKFSAWASRSPLTCCGAIRARSAPKRCSDGCCTPKRLSYHAIAQHPARASPPSGCCARSVKPIRRWSTRSPRRGGASGDRSRRRGRGASGRPLQHPAGGTDNNACGRPRLLTRGECSPSLAPSIAERRRPGSTPLRGLHRGPAPPRVQQ